VLSRLRKKDQRSYVIAKVVKKLHHSLFSPVVAVVVKFGYAIVGRLVGVS